MKGEEELQEEEEEEEEKKERKEPETEVEAISGAHTEKVTEIDEYLNEQKRDEKHFFLKN